MRKLLFLVITFSICSCSKDDIENEAISPLIDNFSYFFMQSPSSVLFSTTSNLVTLDYDSNNRLLTRNGGFSNMNPVTFGFNYVFDPDIAFTFTYLDEEIIIERTPPLVSYLNKKTIFLLEDDKIVQKIVENPDPIMTFYEYNSFDKISKSTVSSYIERTESLFHYNSNKNLDSVVTRTYFFNNPTLVSKVVEVFSNYDNARNPLKNLLLFEDTFYRALSENNYSKYEYFNYGYFNTLVGHEYKEWLLVYDDSGNINFSAE